MALRHADMLEFHLGGERYDGAIFMSETFPLRTERDAFAAHFRCVRTHLRPGGLYIIDIDAHRHGVGATYEVWGQKTLPLEPGHVAVWHESFPGDWVASTQKLVLHCRICLGTEVYETVDEWVLRVDSPWPLAVLVDTLPGWSLVGFYSWRGLSPPHCRRTALFYGLGMTGGAKHNNSVQATASRVRSAPASGRT